MPGSQNSSLTYHAEKLARGTVETVTCYGSERALILDMVPSALTPEDLMDLVVDLLEGFHPELQRLLAQSPCGHVLYAVHAFLTPMHVLFWATKQKSQVKAFASPRRRDALFDRLEVFVALSLSLCLKKTPL